ncbi:lytic transglycosylase domain-containing protein [Rhizobium straminoryzae]|uniref:Lytic transglycosylase domain-containing protein n=1 Tax=Rhizobium straminoryzae TaxID=1387186 RepID=A0A549TAI9_9HYPH|nr:lytic transglycosylase domain-containing protein [Rhizobium straminoryzae]TRL38889.1 lytic transglycosylase domain-containing protein [Rhizobium straminoryzae]
MKKSFVMASIGLSLGAGVLSAAPLPDDGAPVPRPRPVELQQVAMPTPEITGAIPRAPGTGEADTSIAALKAGLDLLSDNDAAGALAVRDRLPQGSLDRHLLTWAIVTSGLRDVPSAEIAAAQRDLQGWPGLSRLRGNSERALYQENPPAPDILAAFGRTVPETPQGAIILARALAATGRAPQAASVLRPFWTGQTLDKDLEDRILQEFGPLLTSTDHRARMDFLMYRNRVSQAKRFGDLGRAAPLYAAWSAVASRAKTAGALLDKAAAGWGRDPAFLFAQIEFLRQQERYGEAAGLLARAPQDHAEQVNATEWWNERRIIARGLADQGDFRNAYRLVANHNAKATADIVDAEFHAGWYALRGLNDPETAETHFQRIIDTSSRPMSASRGWYWLGRAAEQGGSGKAAAFYAKAAAYPATFYGQLAAARLKRKTLDVAYPQPTSEDRRDFQAREAVRAIDRLDAAGHPERADALYRALGEQLTSPGELAILAARAERNGNHALSLQIGKSAFSRGIDVAALAFPVGVIPASANIQGSGKALAYAIARQESAFNPAAVSAADARGLLQILPGTAKGVANRHGMTFTPARLTSDPGYNATLGAHYLGEQIDSFGGSYILTFIAYNAGPKRVPEWIARYGDPRGKSLDEVVDWIERIPFPETRNYVQRVMENYQVYKIRLGQQADIEDDLRFGRR